MKKIFLSLFIALSTTISAQTEPVDYVNPFIGTTNYGTTNPGAMCPQSFMSVTPFNVMGSPENKRDKDTGWWSTPYSYDNSVFTGYAHVNLSGVGCPDMSSLLLMPVSGELEVDYRKYGSKYKDEKATPGYYTNYLTKYNIKTEVSATPRVGITRFTFPQGQNHILLNLGEGLTNETGAMVRKVSDTEIEGTKLLGTFCYTQNQAVFPIYFVMRVSKKPEKSGYWKFQRPGHEWENDWNKDAGKYKLYTKYEKEIAGDDIGAYFTYNCREGETVEVQMGVSFVSIENARMNLEKEQPKPDFDAIRLAARKMWNDDLSRIMVEGGTEDQKVVFYTGLYHMLVHPNILQDVNGQYPAMESAEIKTTKENRYTVYSLWDTYRNLHQMMTLLYPDRQLQMVRTMVDMYKESGWMPKWELYSRESFTMEGDPAIPVITDTWMKGLRDFDINTAYEAFIKSATTPGPQNLLRPDNDDYMNLGYVPLREKYDNSVSHALEYYMADWTLAELAKDLGKKEDAEKFYKRSMGYKHYYSKEYGTFRPILPNGEFLTPFNPLQGADFEPNPGFHEGNAWNYTFAVPHDIPGLMKLMGGKKSFVDKLQSVFDNGYFDVTNEPDIHYPYLFSQIKGEEWRTQKLVKQILADHFTNTPGGLPGNDDTGTISGWAVFSMMGFYPECPGKPDYTLTTPTFDKITIRLDPKYYKSDKVVINVVKPQDVAADYIREVRVDGKALSGYSLTHEALTGAKEITYITSPQSSPKERE
ncbi:glycoside hydrolase family 92 protein [Dysgonomonas sp. 521]|uniref:GH92 family glycosyl hydrolase n=1 Tax=Dysgonomonas sp. 521 TaxID=2302932 RepID=UPI0013D30584|nr:GH92 family glycosyl hydrolase [Dysgonomonas sp. 521]NDV95776.1 glycoside hydrolase family 92 protein [Dysgonomonas sp. 521]